MSIFEQLNAINVNDKTEKKNGLTYLSWAWAWAEVKKVCPNAAYTIYENKDGWNYHTDGRTCWVKTGVTIEDNEYIEYLPVMDFRNSSIPLDKVTSFDVNKAIQRSLTKALARHGLGLYIYAGEDLPDDGKEEQKPTAKAEPTELISKEAMQSLMHQCINDKVDIKKLNKKCGVSTLNQMTVKVYKNVIEHWNSVIEECGMDA